MKTIRLFILAIFLIISNACEIIAQSKSSWNYYKDDFIRIEVYFDGSRIRLMREGLVCRHYFTRGQKRERREAGKGGIVFFNIWESVDFAKLEKLESYLSASEFFSKDTIVDRPGFIVYDIPYLYITVIKGDEIHNITFVDGYCEEIRECLELLNAIVPKKEYRIYARMFKE